MAPRSRWKCGLQMAGSRAGAVAKLDSGLIKVKDMLRLELQCCLADPEARPSVRVVKHVIAQLLGGSADQDPAMTMSNLIPPLPSAMPIYGEPRSSSQVSKLPTMLAPSVAVVPKSSDSTKLRHRKAFEAPRYVSVATTAQQ